MSVRHGLTARVDRRKTLVALTVLSVSELLNSTALAGNIDTSQSYYLASNLGSSLSPDFRGGTLRIDSNASFSQNFTVEDYTGNAIDAYGHNATFSGVLSGTGPMTFIDSVGGGTVTLTGVNTYTGLTTITGGTLALSGSGSIASSSGLVNDSVFDISATTSGASIGYLSGSDSASVLLGSKTLTLTAGQSASFSGVISGSGSLVLSGGTEYLTGANTYTGGTKISSGTLYVGIGGTTGSITGDVYNTGSILFDRSDDIVLTNAITGNGTVGQVGTGQLTIDTAQAYTGVTLISDGRLVLTGSGSIASSSGVTDNADFDISGTSADVSIKSLSGTGSLELGAHTLSLTNASSAVFSGVISGSGGLAIVIGTEILGGTNTYTGGTSVATGSTLQLGNGSTTGSILGNIADSGTVAFNFSSASLATVITGSGGIAQVGSGSVILTAAQGYTGSTTISAGTLALADTADISSSSGVIDNGTFDISSMTSAVSIKSLSGSGTVKLGSQGLVLTTATGVFSGSIVGAGTLEISGGGETLTSSSSYTGNTEIASGATLYLSGNGNISTSSHVSVDGTFDIAASTTTNAVLSLAGSGTVSLGANSLTVSSGADTFSGTIVGNGGLTVNGGTETLTGTNTYLGMTSIYGTLKLTGTGSIANSSSVQGYGTFDISGTTSGAEIKSLNGLGSVVLGAQTLTITAGAGTYTGVISGTGGLVVSGGTQVLSGDNTYTGGTTITGGTLQLGSGYGSGSIVGNVLDNGTLAFSASNGSFSGVISGTGNVTQASGTIILFGANTYTGGTTISGGTLQLGNGGTVGSIVGDVTDNGTFAFDHSDNISFGGTISGTGGVSQLGVGTLTLTGTNTFTGVTTIASGGTLALTGSGSIADSSNVADNGTLDLSALGSGVVLHSLSGTGLVELGAQTLTLSSATGRFSGVIDGTGGVTITGGTETLAGDNTYTGLTQVNAGTLNVDGDSSSSSGVKVASGATLGGTGTVSTVTVANGGAISAGDASVGTLHIDGALQLGSTSVTNVNVSSSGASEIVVDNAAVLGGTLTVTSNGGYALGQKFTVLSASGGLTGSLTLATTSSSGGNFIYALTQDANNVYLQVNLAQLTSFLPGTATANERAASLGIDTAIAAGSTIPTAIEQLGNLSSANLASTLDELTGEIGADTARAAEAVQVPFVSAIFDHMDDVAARFTPGQVTPSGGTWTKIFAGSARIGGDATVGSHDLSEGAWGLAAGTDWNYGRNITLGAAVSYGHATERLAGDLGTGAVNAFQLGGYAFLRWSSHFYGSFAATLGADRLQTLRAASTDTLEGTATALSFSMRYETGLRLSWGTPYVAVRGAWLRLPAYDEDTVSGAGTFALHYDAATNSRTGAELGLKESGQFRIAGGTLQFTGRIAWTHDFTNTYDANAVFQNVVGSDFTVQGVKPMADAGLLSLGADYRMPSGLGFRLGFNSQVSQNSQSYYGDGGLTFRW